MKIVKTPALEYLFMMNPNAKKSNVDKAGVFHTTIAKSLFICNRERPDIQQTVTLLCTIPKGPKENDWNKFLRIIKYLQET